MIYYSICILNNYMQNLSDLRNEFCIYPYTYRMYSGKTSLLRSIFPGGFLSFLKLAISLDHAIIQCRPNVCTRINISSCNDFCILEFLCLVWCSLHHHRRTVSLGYLKHGDDVQKTCSVVKTASACSQSRVRASMGEFSEHQIILDTLILQT